LIAEAVCRDVQEKDFLQLCSRIFANFNMKGDKS